MRRLLAYLLRFAVMVSGFAVAVFTASLFFNLLAVAASGWSDTASFAFGGPIYFSVAVLAAIFGYYAFIPALAAVLLAEFFGRRDWLFHALGGAGVAVAATGFAWQRPAGPAAGDASLMLLLLACGMVGGLAYWAVAGRSAGEWLQDQEKAGSS